MELAGKRHQRTQWCAARTHAELHCWSKKEHGKTATRAALRLWWGVRQEQALLLVLRCLLLLTYTACRRSRRNKHSPLAINPESIRGWGRGCCARCGTCSAISRRYANARAVCWCGTCSVISRWHANARAVCCRMVPRGDPSRLWLLSIGRRGARRRLVPH
jgi:hypothetical protein